MSKTHLTCDKPTKLFQLTNAYTSSPATVNGDLVLPLIQCSRQTQSRARWYHLHNTMTLVNTTHPILFRSNIKPNTKHQTPNTKQNKTQTKKTTTYTHTHTHTHTHYIYLYNIMYIINAYNNAIINTHMIFRTSNQTRQSSGSGYSKNSNSRNCIAN